MKVTGDVTVEVRLVTAGAYHAAVPATPPTYDSGGEPPEGEMIEDVEIDDVMAVHVIVSGSFLHGDIKSVEQHSSLLAGVDRSNPEVRKFLANLARAFQLDIETELKEQAHDLGDGPDPDDARDARMEDDRT